jgi:cyclopropane fatty-acyl-phospholipid synthase-like methyltransferase
MNTDSFKENLIRYYNQEAELRNKSDKADWKIRERQNFLDLLKQENKITLLELGAGAGYDSRFFMDNGLKVIAVDLSREMAAKCREKNIEAYELDFYDLSSLHKKFDSIWAMNTLLHIPKSDLDQVLKGIKSILTDDGLFYMGVYGGKDSETELVTSEVSAAPRFFSFYTKNNLKAILEKYFSIVHFEEFSIERGAEVFTFQSIVMRNAYNAYCV